MRWGGVATALVGLVISLLISFGAWLLFDSLLLFLFIPFVPFLFRGRDRSPRRRCPTCGFETTDDSFEYCPRDGTRLEDARDR